MKSPKTPKNVLVLSKNFKTFMDDYEFFEIWLAKTKESIESDLSVGLGYERIKKLRNYIKVDNFSDFMLYSFDVTSDKNMLDLWCRLRASYVKDYKK